MAQRINTVIVGGGQAGLAISYYLRQEGREHVVLERANAVANAWRNERWDSFTLVTPNFQVRMPGAEYDGSDPNGFMSKAEVIEYFDEYVAHFALPVHCGVEVFTVEKQGNQYLVRTSEGDYEADNVVISTGLYQSPRIPRFSSHVSPSILQLHSSQYRNPRALPAGAVLVVGTGQSGAQIAQELYQSGRKVYLSIGSAGRVPRRYRGKDINDWFTRIGMFDTKVEELKSPRDKFHAHPQNSGKNGGQNLNLHQFARDGVVLLGHVRDARDRQLILVPDLKETLAKVDQFEIDTLKLVDEYIVRTGLAAPSETVPQLRDGYGQEVITELNLEAAGISTIIWAIGYSFDFSLVKLPVVDSDGYPLQKRGVAAYEGLYFLGMPWLSSRRSGILFGVGDDAAYLAAHIAARDRQLCKGTPALTCIREGAPQPGSTGPTFDVVDARVADVAGTAFGDNQGGELRVQSLANSVGYWGDIAATGAAYVDGWPRNGDLVRHDADGFSWCEGRVKQIIVRDGSSISPQEVEEALYHHPAVLEARVIGMPDPAHGEKVIAFVALRRALTGYEQELRDLVRRRIGDYKTPQQIVILPSLPKGRTGKVQRQALKDLALSLEEGVDVMA